MKLYYCKSACSLAVRIILNELNLQFQDAEVDLKAKKTMQNEDFLKINPKGSVPALSLDNGDVLTENQVILQYLADSTKASQLLAPVGDLKRYHTLEWLNYIATELHKTVGIFFHPVLDDEFKTKVYLPMIHLKLNFIDNHLAKGSYLMGEQFTLPDAYLFVIVRWAYYFKMDLSSFTHLEKFMKTVGERPSVVISLEQEKNN